MQNFSIHLDFFFLLALLLSSPILKSQNIVQGKVVDKSNEPLIGVSISLKGSYVGTSSDIDGSFIFSLNQTGKQIIVFRYIGYQEVEKEVDLTDTPTSLSITLYEKATALQPVEIVAGSFSAGEKVKSVVLQPLDILTTATTAGDIYGALSTLPGNQTVGEEGKIFVRGGEAYETKTVIDGMLVESPYLNRMAGIPTRSRFSPMLFSGTTFSTGGYSAEYGQALSSVLLLSTNSLPGKTRTNINLMSLGIGLSHTHSFENSSLVVSTDYSNLKPYFKLVEQNTKWIKPPETLYGTLFYVHSTQHNGMIKSLISYNYDNSKIQYPYYGYNNPYPTINMVNGNVYALTSYSHELSESWFLIGGISYARDVNSISFDNLKIDDHLHTAQQRVKLTARINDNIKTSFGGDLYFLRFNEDINDSGINFRLEHRNTQVSTFAEMEFTLSSNLAFKVGGRAEYASYIDSYFLVPRISMAYRLNQVGQVSLAYGKYYQNPEIHYLKFSQVLTPENSQHFIVNYQIEKNKRVFRVEGYYKKYNNLVTFITENEPNPANYTNLGFGYANGVDFFFREKRLIRNGDFWVSYSLLDTERKYRNYPSPARPIFFAKHNLTLVYKQWISSISSNIGITYTHHSGRSYYNPNRQGQDFLTDRTTPYNDLSINYTYDISYFSRLPLTFFFMVNNVLGFDNVFGYRASTTPNQDGVYELYPIKPQAKRFFMVAFFLNLSK